jgi:hypothetical protein
MLQYVIQFLAKKDIKLLKFYEELQSVHAAARVDPSKLKQDLAALKHGIKRIEKFRNTTTPRINTEDRFNIVISSFLADAEYTMDKIQLQQVMMEDNLRKLAMCYGEDPTDMIDNAYDSFFNNVSDFVNQFTANAKHIVVKQEPAKRHNEKQIERTLVRPKHKHRHR